ncbi:MAG: hypothetical protein QNK42_18220 [Pseudodonghicola sp.]|nr:hypothetical protein [Pseudodonghicola sp.]
MPQRLNRIVLALAVVLASAGIVRAEAVTDAITRQLRQQGYTQITVTRTFLGRARIVATSPDQDREIIVNPRTNEILRDYSESRETGDATAPGRGLLDLFSQAQGVPATDSGAGGEDGADDGGDDGADGGGGESGDGGDGGDGDGGGDD